MYRTEKQKQELIIQLRRIEGQIRGIQAMLENDRYCIDILTQIQAARASLTNVGLKILEGHAKGCVVSAIQEGREEIIDEMMDTIRKFSK